MKTESLARQLVELKSASLPELRALWQALFLTSPPLQPAVYLRPRLAYRLQELKLGGLSDKTRQDLAKRMADLDPHTLDLAPSPDQRLLPGTRLVRQWKGVAHEVEVLSGGFSYQGRLYKSLSAIARTITGTQWNGPLFWGLRSHKVKMKKHKEEKS